ncbi:MAG: hypothetical protein WCS42_25185 [Verrucomicrobiota bacterium]
MIRIATYRRPSIEQAEGFQPAPVTLASLAFYKGDSSAPNTQTSNQTGAQTQGLVNSGTANSSPMNTGTQINLGISQTSQSETKPQPAGIIYPNWGNQQPSIPVSAPAPAPSANSGPAPIPMPAGNTYASASNSGISSQGSSGDLYTAAGENSAVTVVNGTPISASDIKDGLQSIFDGIKNILTGQPGTTVVVNPAANTDPWTGSATVTPAAASADAPGKVTDNTATTLTKWQMLAAIVAVFGTLYLIFKKKSA